MKKGKLCLLGLLIFILVVVGYFQIKNKKISGKVEFKPRLADSFFTEESVYHLHNINLYPVYKYTEIMDNLEPVKVGIVGMGINPEHNYLEYEGAAYNKSLYKNEYDRDGHGTHIAGIIAAEKNPNNHVMGVAPNVELYIYKVGEKNFISGIRKALNYFHGQEVKIVNLSLGTHHTMYFYKVIKKAYKNGLTLIGAAGNQGTNHLTNPVDSSFPAYYDEVIAVGATNGYYERWKDSNYGEQLDLVAPGFLIETTAIDLTNEGEYSEKNNTAYTKVSGTSISTPIITGLAALLKGQNPDLTNKEIKELLTTYTYDIGDKLKVGAGIPDAYRLLTRTKLEEAVVFLGEKEGNTINKVSGIYRVKNGKFSFKEKITEETKLFIWIDVDESGGINPGDYFYSAEPGEDMQAKIDITDSKYNLE